MTDTVGVIGVGNMGSALVKGWLRAGRAGLLVWDTFRPSVDRLVEDAQASMADGAKGPSVAATESLEQLVGAADIIVVLVKPKDAKDLLGTLRGITRPDQALVSAMAGLTLEWLRDELGPGPALLRAMPNLAVEKGAGAVAVAAEDGVDAALLERVLALFGQTGIAEALPEELFDVFTAVSGSSPAFLALALEGLEDGAVAAGLSRADARRVVRRAALETAVSSDADFELRSSNGQGATAGGQLSAGAAALLESRGLRSAFSDAVAAAMERSRQMRKA